jgi:hypothetical protein
MSRVRLFGLLLCVLAASCAPGLSRPAGAAPQIGGCPMFPDDSIWNTPIDAMARDPRSDAYIASIGADRAFHPDFGSDPTYGIPFDVVPQSQPGVSVAFDYADESDQVGYPIPASPRIEAGSDHHILLVQQGTCKLFELWDSRKVDGAWEAGSGAVFDLNSHALRPDTWTSADAAGLPILPGLVRRDEVEAGEIKHALRFTAVRTRKAHIWPARHDASSVTDLNVPPMGQRFRLKASVDVARFPAYVRPILVAMKRYGLILADNGSNWYVSGANDTGWDDEALDSLKGLRGSDFEAIDVTVLQVGPDSGQARPVPLDMPVRAYVPGVVK